MGAFERFRRATCSTARSWGQESACEGPRPTAATHPAAPNGHSGPKVFKCLDSYREPTVCSQSRDRPRIQGRWGPRQVPLAFCAADSHKGRGTRTGLGQTSVSPRCSGHARSRKAEWSEWRQAGGNTGQQQAISGYRGPTLMKPSLIFLVKSSWCLLAPFEKCPGPLKVEQSRQLNLPSPRVSSHPPPETKTDPKSVTGARQLALSSWEQQSHRASGSTGLERNTSETLEGQEGMILGLQPRERLAKVEGFMPHYPHPVQPHFWAMFCRQWNDPSRKPSFIAASLRLPSSERQDVFESWLCHLKRMTLDKWFDLWVSGSPYVKGD